MYHDFQFFLFSVFLSAIVCSKDDKHWAQTNAGLLSG